MALAVVGLVCLVVPVVYWVVGSAIECCCTPDLPEETTRVTPDGIVSPDEEVVRNGVVRNGVVGNGVADEKAETGGEETPPSYVQVVMQP